MSSSGVLVVDKPEGPTSHDIVAAVRRLARTRVGHAGTLDPLATGVLVLALGPATRLMRYFSDDKEYRARIRLGVSTETLDREGRVTSRSEIPDIGRDEARTLVESFAGEIQQRAPLYSAVKVQGRRLHEMARRGETVDAPLRSVTIHEIRLLEQQAGTWDLHLHCSAGTYVRTLADDIGARLGCGAHLESLRRLRSGPFDLSLAVGFAELPGEWRRALVSVDVLLPELHRLDLDEPAAGRVRHGNAIEGRAARVGEPVRLFAGGHLIAVGRQQAGGRIQPETVLANVGREH